MEVQTISMERGQAREAFLDYRRAVRERYNRVDKEIMDGYRLLASGKQLIRLGEVLRAGGLDDRTHLPKLAIMRADEDWCYVQLRERTGGGQYLADQWLRSNASRRRVEIPPGTFPADEFSVTFGFRAIVPIVPPRLRPRGSLRSYHVLWEADWALAPAPPRDPALLRHIGGELYAVVAVWDLTELERAVLAGSRARLP